MSHVVPRSAPLHRHSLSCDSLNRAYRLGLSRSLMGWATGIALAICFTWGGPSLVDALLISFASGLVAMMAMIPGLKLARDARTSVRLTAEQLQSRFFAALFAGMMIRLAGTVALFLTCRYEMASSTEMIAGMTIGWYVLMTSIEVFVLARELPKTAKAPNSPETSLG